MQAYTAFGYAGVGFPRELKDDVSRLLAAQGSSWTNEVERAQKKWTSGVDRLQRELEREADRLKEVRQAPRHVPLEDVLAEDGIDVPVAPAPAAVPQSQPAREAPQPQAPAASQALLTHGAAATTPPATDASAAPRIEAPPAPSAATEPIQPTAAPTSPEPPRLDTAAWRSVVNASDKRIV